MIATLSELRYHPYGRILLLLFFFLLPATLVRFGLYFAYAEDFQSLSLGQAMAALWFGLRFDLSLTVLVIGVPLLFMLLPFRWSHRPWWQGLWGWFVYLAILLFVFMMVVDAIYFGYVHRHVGAEINTLSGDMDSMVGLALGQHRGALLLFVFFALLGAWYWRKLITAVPKPPKKWRLRLVSLPLIFLAMFVVGRGGFTGKPISVGEAFFSDSLPQGYLALNGAFAMSRAIIEEPPPLKTFMPSARAVELTQSYLSSAGSNFPEPDYPLFQMRQAKPVVRQPNVVVLMLESWGALHIDAMRQQMGLPPLGVTPNFDALAKQGRLYTRFYANGQRSIQGVAAMLASMPTFPSMPFMGEGMEQNRLSFMGEIAAAHGYETIFLQSSDRGSLRLDVVAARAGFGTYHGAQDIPNLHEKPKAASTWGTWDHNTFQDANQLLAHAKQPFLGFIFSSSTHVPWLIPGQRWQKFTGMSDLDSYLNSLFYADWALGEFITAAKRSGYFDNTIFVITADHVNEFVEHVDHTPNLFHIPLLIIGPGVQTGVDATLGSQYDVLPTLMDLAGWSGGYAGVGRSLLGGQRDEARASLSIRGNVLNWITPQGWVSHDLTRSVGHAVNLSDAMRNKMEQQLLAIYQVTSQAQSSNRLLPVRP